MQNLDMQTPDITSMNIENIAKLFPNVITEKEENWKTIKAIDFDLLKQQLSKELVEDNEERYTLNWPWKNASLLKANTPINKTLRPCKEDSVDFDTTENLYIEWDNFEVLKILQESYLWKVKMIYIDPPYNTGKDFVYRDNFKVSKDEYEEDLWTEDEEGWKLFKNTDTNGRFHSDWLSMMYERLTVARDLLKDDWVIFMSIDDNEVHNLRKITDEVFGEENFISQLSVINNLKWRSDDNYFATCHENLLVYSKNKIIIKWFELDEEEMDKDYDSQDNNWFYKLIWLRKTWKWWERVHRPYMFYPILEKNNTFSTITKDEFNNIYDSKKWFFDDSYIWELKNKYETLWYSFYLPMDTDWNFWRWRWWFERFHLEKDINVKMNSANSVCSKMRATYEDWSIRVKTSKTLWYKSEYDTGSAWWVLKKLFNTKSNFFDNPKSVFLLKDILYIISDKNDIILDFFSWSGTTAHATMQLNTEDQWNRKFICVQIPEETDEKSDVFKAWYKNICEIWKERIRRAWKKILEENKEELEKRETPLDTWFRVYKTDSSNMKDVFYHPSELEQTNLLDVVSNIKEDRSSEDLLTQVILDLGLTLDMPIKKKEILWNTVYFVAWNSLVACFDENINFDIVDEIAKEEPLRVVFRDSCFKTDSDRINFENKFKKISGESDIRVI